MDAIDNKPGREEIYSIAVRAGKRTYFFDVKETRAKEKYLTITESKRRFNNDSGKFFYEKHKLFLYKEDFDKFADGLAGVIDYIRANPGPEEQEEENHEKTTESTPGLDGFETSDEVKDDVSGTDTDQEPKLDDDSYESEKEDDKF